MFGPHLAIQCGVCRVALTFGLIGWLGSTVFGDHHRGDARSSSVTRRELTLDDRVRYERRIEEVYWRHRIWPAANPRRKPPLDEVLPVSSVRARVEEYLLKSQALATYWQRPISGDQLQAEMDRMARQTNQPAMLKEVWAALGNDPYVIAECMARPSLANKLIRAWYAHDDRYHGALRFRAETQLRAFRSVDDMHRMSGAYREMEWTNNAASNVSAGSVQDESAMSPAEWSDNVRQLALIFEAGITESPLGVLSSLQEDDERFYVVAVLAKADDHVRLATVEWLKESFETWWHGAQRGAATSLPAPEPHNGYRLTPIESRPGACVDDTWQPTSSPYLSGRTFHTAVWTGSEMIVWGGAGVFLTYPFATGGRYDPTTDTWASTNTANAPSARSVHTAVWTGSEMIVWGGQSSDDIYSNPYLSTGGRYDPTADSWTATATSNAPGARIGHTAVWTGSEMIIWGGLSRQYDPFSEQWIDVALHDGGRFDPASSRWTSTPTANAPSARSGHTAVWTGSEMILWGGGLSTGGRFAPLTGNWTPTSTTNAPVARGGHTAVWSGSEMIIWGGLDSNGRTVLLNTGGRYDPATDNWNATSTDGAPTPRAQHSAVATGDRMIVWGGYDRDASGTGGRYDFATDTWTPTAALNAPSARFSHTAVWTGAELIVWGGAGRYLNDTGGRYDPVTDTWKATATTNVPNPRWRHSTLWTGSEMIVWGGAGGNGTGGRYDPATDTWTPIALSAAYGPAIWTGREMLVWSRPDSGGRYDPTTDTWTDMTPINAPAARSFHTAVWTGREMIVWGGDGGGSNLLDTGARYDPSGDTWIPTSLSNVPMRRWLHTGVWTGDEMIVWGGVSLDSSGFHGANTGGRYDPRTDTWTSTSTTNAIYRSEHTAVWADGQMIVWGGKTSQAFGSNTGARYVPATDNWMATATTGAPSGRLDSSAVWTGTEMIVWGGFGESGPVDTGGRYCASTGSSVVPHRFR